MQITEIITQLSALAADAKGRIDPEDPDDVFLKDYEALTCAMKILGNLEADYVLL